VIRDAAEKLAFQRGKEALAHRVVVGAIEGRTPASRRRLSNSMEVYCEPWSEWWITPFGRRIASAMFKASSTSRVASVVTIDHPTTGCTHPARPPGPAPDDRCPSLWCGRTCVG
jgi:hypothetical protein